MKWNHEKIDWVEKLRTHKIVPGETRYLLWQALERGGFVSGGFARALAVCLLSDSDVAFRSRADELDRWDSLQNYLWVRGVPPKSRGGDAHRMWKAGAGDVDVFFRDKASASEVIKKLISGAQTEAITWHAPTLAGYGHEFLSGATLVQLIEKLCGTPEEVLSAFDIANAKVYLDATGLHWTDEWAELEKGRLIGIDRSDKPNLLWRVKKWWTKHRYVDLRPGDHSKWVESVMEICQKAAREELKAWNLTITEETVLRHGKVLMHTLPPSELLKLSIVYDGYDKMQIMKTLIKNNDEAT